MRSREAAEVLRARGLALLVRSCERTYVRKAALFIRILTRVVIGMPAVSWLLSCICRCTGQWILGLFMYSLGWQWYEVAWMEPLERQESGAGPCRALLLLDGDVC